MKKIINYIKGLFKKEKKQYMPYKYEAIEQRRYKK